MGFHEVDRQSAQRRVVASIHLKKVEATKRVVVAEGGKNFPTSSAGYVLTLSSFVRNNSLGVYV